MNHTMSNSADTLCCYCGKPAEGNYTIHARRDFTGPEVPLCDACGGHEIPTCEQIWDKLEPNLLENAG